MKLASLIATACLCMPILSHAVAVADVAPDFTLKTLDGKNTRLKEYRGQVVLINFWASWCGPCRQEMPLLEKIDKRYRDAGFTVLGVNVEGKAGSGERSCDEGGRVRFRCSSTTARRSARCTRSSRCRAAWSSIVTA